MVGCLAGVVSGFWQFGHFLPFFQILLSNHFSAVLLSGNISNNSMIVIPFLKCFPGAFWLMHTIRALYIYSLLKYIIPIFLNVLVKRDGMSVTGAALHLGMAPSWGVKWHNRYLKEGIAGLQTRTRSGRPPRISGETLKAVKKK